MRARASPSVQRAWMRLGKLGDLAGVGKTPEAYFLLGKLMLLQA